jgi:hypothetical protein
MRAAHAAFRPGFGRLGSETTDAQFLAAHADLLESTKDLERHSFRQIEHSVIVADLDVPEVARVQAGFLRQRTADVIRLNPVNQSDLEAKRLGRKTLSFSIPSAPPLSRLLMLQLV